MVTVGKMERHAEQEGLRTALFWLACAAMTWAIYWICLRFLYPAYFAPLSPFHVDFYDYAAVRERGFFEVMRGYPRPVSFLGLKLLASGGMTSLMGGGVAIALINVLLTLAVVRRMLRLDSPWLPASYAVYAFLLFAHPQFYIEHRHDLPAEICWFFLAVSLLAWMSWVENRKPAMLAVALLCAVLFAFSKETYFISAPILVFGMAIVNRSERRRHLVFLAFLLAVELASFAWTSHVNSPFVNLNADAASTYHIVLAPGSVARTYWFYLSQLLNPFLVAIAALGLMAAWDRPRQFVLTSAWLLAGLTVFATLAVLPNHKFEEYAWAAAPLFLAPVLTLCKPGFSFHWKAVQIGLPAVLAAMAIFGPAGYYKQYRTDASRWWVAQDQRSRAVWSSLDRFQAIPRPARILVSGLDDPLLPWQVKDFVQREFGDGILWTVALPPDIQYRRTSGLVKFANAADLRLSNFDYVAGYRADGHLAGIRSVKDIPVSGDPAEAMLPDLEGALRNSRSLLQGAELCIHWGFLPEAAQLLDQAREAGADAGTWQRLSADLQSRQSAPAPASPVSASESKAQLTANPAHVVTADHSGLGITELIWNAPAGVETEIHVGSPGGPLFTAGGNTGRAATEKWVRNGMQFYLQDVTGGKPLTPENTLAVASVEVTP